MVAQKLKHCILGFLLFMDIQNTATAQVSALVGSSDSLVYIVRPSSASQAGNSPMLVLLHGYGSNERDLFTLFSGVPGKWTVIALRGPVALQRDMFAWYHVQQSGGKIAINTAEEAASRRTIVAAIDHLADQYKADKKRIVLAGFSQGASLAEVTALLHPLSVSGFAVFSGRLLAEVVADRSPSASLSHLKVFIAHGSGDNLLPQKYATDNITMLRSMGLAPVFAGDVTGHTISPAQHDAFVSWLKQFE